MRQLIAGNWKMNGLRAEADRLAAALRGAEAPRGLMVCPPATLVAQVAASLAGSAVRVGGQDCSAEPPGAHTGEVAAAMLADAGASSVILGHSERRQQHHETDDLVRRKSLAAAASGLLPIVCVGETAAQRQSGRETEVVGQQLAGSLPQDFAGIIAYEPCWAIGTGQIPAPEQVAAMHAFIRAELMRQFMAAGRGLPILYGGSVKPDNAAALLALPDVNGALVGGASLDPAAFLGIARA